MVALLTGVSVFETALQTQHHNADEARARVKSVAQTFASSAGLGKALKDPAPSTDFLQIRAEKARRIADVEFIVVTTPQGVLLTHPRPGMPRKGLLGTIGRVQRGHVVLETLDEPDGSFVQAVAPVTDAQGRVVGLVAVGLGTDAVPSITARQLPLLVTTGVVTLLVAIGGTALVTRRLRRQTRGLDPATLAQMYEHHDAVLHVVKEGVLIFDGENRLILANDEALKLLNIPRKEGGVPIFELGIEPGLSQLLVSGDSVVDKVIPAGERLLLVNYQHTDQHGGPAGSVVTLRDTTELRVLSEQAESARRRLKLLYDAGNYVGKSLDITQTTKELTDFAVEHFADFATIDLAIDALEGQEPAPTTRMQRTAVSGVKEEHPLYPVNSLFRYASTTPHFSGFDSGKAILVPSLRESIGYRKQDPALTGRVLSYGIHSMITAPLMARGEIIGMASFFRSEDYAPFNGEDLSFAEELTARAAVSIDNARRFTRERNLAISLQRSLLPQALPQQNALEVAYRYLPAQAHAGGDWFDIIPLSGARVALVVGDVVGHGLQAAASMGRLRTAVHNFSALDLAPDDMLAHLNELVTRTENEISDPEENRLVGTTCLYGIYDPVTRNFSVALAGHPPPVFMKPDHTLECPDMPAGPPLGLGLGGLPFETSSLQLPEGSNIVLFTDGLIENRSAGIAKGLVELYDALARNRGTPEQICEAVLDQVLSPPPRDDVALLVARTHALRTENVAEWDCEPTPSAVSALRAATGSKLKEWQLEEEAFTTELIISELVTNAIRYSTGNIHVRLIRDRYLICEVYDSSSTSPHLRRAATTDEGGRGLYLISQFADCWGVRYLSAGKVIWTEQQLPEPLS